VHVCSIIVQKCVDSNTGLPLTFGVVERALREVHFAVHLARPAKQQALSAIKILERSFSISRAKMRVRVELSDSADCEQVIPASIPLQYRFSC
jgi:ribosome maturation protein SDO1